MLNASRLGTTSPGPPGMRVLNEPSLCKQGQCQKPYAHFTVLDRPCRVSGPCSDSLRVLHCALEGRVRRLTASAEQPCPEQLSARTKASRSRWTRHRRGDGVSDREECRSQGVQMFPRFTAAPLCGRRTRHDAPERPRIAGSAARRARSAQVAEPSMTQRP